MVSAGMAGIVSTLSRNSAHGLKSVSAERCAQVLGMTGVAVTVLTPGAAGEVIWRSDGSSARLDDLHVTLGEGPAVDAAIWGELVLESDLAAVPWQRWPAFTPAAIELGVRAVFAIPMQIGAIRLGVLLAHRNVPGPMGDGSLADALAFVSAATGALLGPATTQLDVPQWFAEQPTGFTAQIHQATGMISAQLGVKQAEAMVRMRAYAFGQRRVLADVAADVLAQRLRFDKDAE
jgi:hypothetical protein